MSSVEDFELAAAESTPAAGDASSPALAAAAQQAPTEDRAAAAAAPVAAAAAPDAAPVAELKAPEAPQVAELKATEAPQVGALALAAALLACEWPGGLTRQACLPLLAPRACLQCMLGVGCRDSVGAVTPVRRAVPRVQCSVVAPPHSSVQCNVQ